jgi:hypothetical protein
VHGDNVHPLGAESLEYISKQLLPALSIPWEELEQPVAGEINGYSVKWVLTLSEEHSTLYLSIDGNTRLLYWQDKDANLIFIIYLSAEQATQWKGQLEGA